MKTAFVIPVYEADSVGFNVSVESIRKNMASLNPVIVAVCDPRSEWHPETSDVHVVGPNVVRNIRGIKWIKTFHRLLIEILDRTQATHLIKTDADVLWMHDRVLDKMKFRSFGFLRYKAAMKPYHWMGMGYGWQADFYRKLHAQWVGERMYDGVTDQDGAAEDVATYHLTSLIDHDIAAIPGPYGINWNMVDEKRVRNATAVHCGQNYSARWRGGKTNQRALMNEAMVKLWENSQISPAQS